MSSNEVPALLLSGGRPRTDEASFTKMLSLAFENKVKPKVAYIGAANGDSVLFFQAMKLFLLKAGAASVKMVRLAKKNINIEKAKNDLSSADVIFISGGEVEDGMNWLKTHDLAEFLSMLYTEGKQFLTVSAGSIMMGKYWVRWDVPGDDSTSSLFDCLGIVPHTFDTHAESEDWIELKAALKLMGDGSRGCGIRSGGMISADSKGVIVNIKKELLVYVNEKGQIREL